MRQFAFPVFPELVMSLFDASTEMIGPERGSWEESARDGFHPWHQPLRRSPFFSLPTTERSWIDNQATSQLLLCEACSTAASDEAFAKSLGLRITGNVTQESDDLGHEAELAGRAVDLPIADGDVVNTELVTYLALQET